MTTATESFPILKLERAFEALDADQDGFLSWADYDNLARRYLSAYRLDKDDRRSRALLAFFQMHWLELLRHAGVNADRLSKDQFVTARRLASIDTSRQNLTDGGAHAIFDVIDVDGDNEIDRQEFDRLLRDVCLSDPSGTVDVFSGLDADGDGRVSRQEFLRAIREHFLSDAPEAPGNQFFGHI
ncbi:EF-hand domain-containing protein [Streptomyces sp. NPDC007088]|uniref:EF-hand domain-containing protein n=1 Tax=Streptomyces sp. NPDC007088 TaxID=3364773 RepID=UPI0036C09C37